MELADIEIVTLPAREWQAYRRLRLEALRDSPQAFGSSYIEQAAKPDSYWQARLEEASKGERSWLLYARAGQDLLGMVGAFREGQDNIPNPSQTAMIVSLYVTPPARGQGISRMLMQAILGIVSQNGFQKVQLGVTASQTAALRLYQYFGFTILKTEKQRMGDGLDHTGYIMEKTLGLAAKEKNDRD